MRSETPKYKLLFILDSYDEIKEEFQYKNLYDSNDLDEWGPSSGGKFSNKLWPKIIITCRSEFTDGRTDRQKWFRPNFYGNEYNSNESY